MDHKTLNTLLKQLYEALSNRLGNRLQSIYLYGSHARGEARLDSDIDVLIVLNIECDPYQMINQTGDIAAELSLQYDTVISFTFATAEYFNQMQIPFFMNIRKEGILIQ